jgi:hypothetical protein
MDCKTLEELEERFIKARRLRTAVAIEVQQFGEFLPRIDELEDRALIEIVSHRAEHRC